MIRDFWYFPWIVGSSLSSKLEMSIGLCMASRNFTTSGTWSSNSWLPRVCCKQCGRTEVRNTVNLRCLRFFLPLRQLSACLEIDWWHSSGQCCTRVYLENCRRHSDIADSLLSVIPTSSWSRAQLLHNRRYTSRPAYSWSSVRSFLQIYVTGKNEGIIYWRSENRRNFYARPAYLAWKSFICTIFTGNKSSESCTTLPLARGRGWLLAHENSAST